MVGRAFALQDVYVIPRRERMKEGAMGGEKVYRRCRHVRDQFSTLMNYEMQSASPSYVRSCLQLRE